MPVTINPTSWPLVLCGPILRRVTPQRVSVFVALKYPRRVRLNVFNGSDTSQTAVATGSRDTIRLGALLHVAVVTANATAPLSGGINYYYDLTFERTTGSPGDSGSANTSIEDDWSELGGVQPLGYDGDTLPSFALPPASLARLTIVHASCRKAHGHGKDALPELDAFIGAFHGQPLDRPHHLFLTGDQIYADDVATPLSAVLTANAKALLGWDESLPLAAGPRLLSTVMLGTRELLVHRELGFSSGEADNHLLGLGEFYGMYLLAWSDATWPDSLPTFTEAGPPLFPDADVYATEKRYDDEAGAVGAFYQGIASVRRVLANVPSLMMMDDHEVTDDWYLHRGWVHGTTISGKPHAGVFARNAGKRVIQNALAAFSVFQAWGNTPERFDTGTEGGEVLAALTTWQGVQAEDAASRVALRDAFGLPDDGTSAPADVTKRLRFDFTLEYATHAIAVLDTRTERQYLPSDSTNPDSDLYAAALLSDARMAELGQFLGNLPAEKLKFVLSPAPVLGHPVIERKLETAVHKWPRPPIIAAESGLSATVDFEAWAYNRPAFEKFVGALSRGVRVVLLSGDVHYSSTVAMSYWYQPAPSRTAKIVQCTSSALKNSPEVLVRGAKEMARQLPFMVVDALVPGLGVLLKRGAAGVDRLLYDIPDRAVAGWPSGGLHLEKGGKVIHVTGEPAVCDLPSAADNFATTPDWLYRLNYPTDNKPPGDRYIDVTRRMPLKADAEYLKRAYSDTSFVAEIVRKEQTRAVIARNSFGVITFLGDGTSNASVLMLYHEHWYRMDGTAKPYSIHAVPLSPPDVDTPKPAANSVGVPYKKDVGEWAALLSFRPPQQVQEYLATRNYTVPGGGPDLLQVQCVERGRGKINLDFYPILVERLPTQLIDGILHTAETYLNHIRLNLNPLTLPAGQDPIGTFEPYNDTERAKWLDLSQALGAVGVWTVPVALFLKENMTVFVSDVRFERVGNTAIAGRWIFSTLFTSRYQYHPVSGNREFGFYETSPGANGARYVFYTRGVDRISNLAVLPAAETAFTGGDALWRQFQLGVAAEINSHGGSAQVLTSATETGRYDWDSVAAKAFAPTQRWLDPSLLWPRF